MKIVSSGRVLNSREFYEKKKKRRRIRFILFFILFLSVVYLLVFLLRQERFLITDVSILGENIVDKDDMVEIIRQKLDGKYLWFIPRANALVYPRRAIKQSLLKEFPRLKSVNLNLDEQYRILVTIDERAPFALYCPKVGDCFFLNEEGFIFATAPSFSRGVYFIYLAEDMIENPIGQRFISDIEFKSLLAFMEKLKDLDIRPTSLKLGTDDYTLVLPQDGQIVWRKDSNFNFIQSNLEVFLTSDAVRAQSDFLDRILYIDLRTENKVFYKFK